MSSEQEIKDLKSIILELIQIIEDISIDRYGRIEIDTRSLYELRQKLSSQAEVVGG